MDLLGSPVFVFFCLPGKPWCPRHRAWERPSNKDYKHMYTVVDTPENLCCNGNRFFGMCPRPWRFVDMLAIFAWGCCGLRRNQLYQKIVLQKPDACRNFDIPAGAALKGRAFLLLPPYPTPSLTMPGPRNPNLEYMPLRAFQRSYRLPRVTRSAPCTDKLTMPGWGLTNERRKLPRLPVHANGRTTKKLARAEPGCC